MYAGLSPICEHCEQVLVYEESEYNSLTEDAVTEAQVTLQDVGEQPGKVSQTSQLSTYI